MNLYRLDGIIDDAEPDDDWIAGEMLLHYREMLNI